MAQLINETSNYKVYKVTNPNNVEILHLGVWSLMDPIATAKYMSLGKIFILVNKEKPLVTIQEDFFKTQNQDQVIGILLAVSHIRNRVNGYVDFNKIIAENPDLLVGELKEELEKYPYVQPAEEAHNSNASPAK